MSVISTEESPHRESEESSGGSDDLRAKLAAKYSPMPASHYKYLKVWKRVYLRIRLKKAISSLSNDIILFGTSNEVLDVGSYEEIMEAKKIKEQSTILIEKRLPWYLLSPSSPYLYVWNIIIALLLVYTATLMPYRIAFQEPVYFDSFTIFETVVDFIFIKDIFVNFVTSFRTDAGDYERNLWRVMLSYIKSWFFIDVLSSFPMGIIEYTQGLDPSSSANKANRLARLARLPRLYKLLRILRISKLSRVYKGSPFYERIEDWFDVNGRFLRFFKSIMSIFLFVHFFACFFYFAAKIEGMSADTWIFQMGYQDKTEGELYLASFYWAFTTIATVGYGDIHAFTEVEMVVCIIAMAVGVGVYSMIISSITSLLSSIDLREAEIANKVKAAEDFGEEAGLSRETINKIRQVINYNASVFSVDNMKLLEEMPKTLKAEVVFQMYNGIVKSMPMFAKKDSAYAVFVMPRLKPLLLEQDEEVYEENDTAEEIYIIMKGRVSLLLPDKRVGFKDYLKGTNFGEVEILANCKRIDTAIVLVSTELLTMSKDSYLEVLDEFPNELISMRLIAIERFRQNHETKMQIMNTLGIDNEVIKSEDDKHKRIFKGFNTAENVLERGIALSRMQKLDRELYDELENLEHIVKGLNEST